MVIVYVEYGWWARCKLSNYVSVESRVEEIWWFTDRRKEGPLYSEKSTAFVARRWVNQGSTSFGTNFIIVVKSSWKPLITLTFFSKFFFVCVWQFRQRKLTSSESNCIIWDDDSCPIRTGSIFHSRFPIGYYYHSRQRLATNWHLIGTWFAQINTNPSRIGSHIALWRYLWDWECKNFTIFEQFIYLYRYVGNR